MKLQQLAMGARFEYEGVTYVKTGPMTASSDAGGQRIIPRYANLRVLEEPVAESKAPIKGRLEAVRVRTAFERFYRSASDWLAKAGRQNWPRRARRFWTPSNDTYRGQPENLTKNEKRGRPKPFPILF